MITEGRYAAQNTFITFVPFAMMNQALPQKAQLEFRKRMRVKNYSIYKVYQKLVIQFQGTHKNCPKGSNAYILPKAIHRFGAQINGIVTKAKSSFENITTIIKSFMSFET
ncbi:hypothetical protein T11_1350 [Trichinella zimbabwensis]|uniref:Uncharacterized protein n=1 Tax=Trichinella zimbabwensis TaxID=268475 RepID=A0A0V1HKU0_9BILA|nr:hypothetical protein T11_1350 [Trichinella zimbabwensis]